MIRRLALALVAAAALAAGLGLLVPEPRGENVVDVGEDEVVGSADGAVRLRGLPTSTTGPSTAPVSPAAAGRTLRGRVVALADGSPVAGARIVTVREPDCRTGMEPWVSAAATTGKDGSFEVEAPLPEGCAARLIVEAAGFARLSALLEPLPAEATLSLDLPSRLRGRVVTDADGAPCPGARVHARAGEGGDEGVVSTVADEAGRFALDVPPGSRPAIFVHDERWVSAEFREGCGGDDEALRMRMPPSGGLDVVLRVVAPGRIAGRVTEDGGRPVAGALVETEPIGFAQGPPLALRSATTAADGTFAVGGIAPDIPQEVRVRAPGRARPPVQRVSVGAGAVATLELVLPRSRAIDVRVVDDGTGVPIPNTWVGISPSCAGTGTWDGTRTDDAGRARVAPAPIETLEVRADAEGYCSQAQRVEAEVALPQVTLRLVRGLAVQGQVLRADGSPVAGIAVVIADAWDAVPWEQVTTDDRGTFRFGAVAPGVHRLSLRYEEPDGSSAEVRPVVPAGATDVRIELPVGSRPRGGGRDAAEDLVIRVVDAGGAPVPIAATRVSVEGGTSSPPVRDGEVRLARSAVGGDLDVFDATTLEGRPLPCGPLSGIRILGSQEVRLPPERTLQGRVLRHDGAPAAGVRVGARPQVGEWGAGADSVTQRDGTFRIGGLGTGEHDVFAWSHRASASTVPVAALPDGPPVEIRLDAEVDVAIRVEDERGTPIPGARIAARWDYGSGHGGTRIPPSPSESASSFTDERGVGRLRGLVVGLPWGLRVSAPDPERADATRSEWWPKDEVFRLTSRRRVLGTVVDALGRPAAGATIEMRRSDGSWVELRETSDERGRFDLFLASGAIPNLTVLRAGWPTTEYGRRRMDAGPETPVGDESRSVSLVSPGARVDVVVDDWPGWASWVHAELRSEDSRYASSERVDGTGEVAFAGAPLGVPLLLSIGPVGDGLVLHAARLTAGGGPVHVRLGQGLALRGRLDLPRGARDVEVWALVPGLGAIPGTVERDGRFEIRGVPPGDWEVTARATAGDQPYDGEAVLSTSSGGTIQLEVRKPG